MNSIWMDLSVGQIIDEEGEPTSEGEETINVIEKPEFTERMEITRINGEVRHITQEQLVGLHTMLNFAIQRINERLQESSFERGISSSKDKGGDGLL